MMRRSPKLMVGVDPSVLQVFLSKRLWGEKGLHLATGTAHVATVCVGSVPTCLYCPQVLEEPHACLGRAGHD